MSNQKVKRGPKDGFTSHNEPQEKVSIRKASQQGSRKAPALLIERSGASVGGNSGYTTPDTFISLPSYQRNHLQTLQSASRALESYIRDFQGQSKEKYLTASLSNLLSPTPSVLLVNMVDRMVKEGTLNNFEDSNSLIEWVNKAFRKELDRTCTPAYETQLRNGAPDVSKGEILRHIADVKDGVSVVSSLPPSPDSDADDVDTINTDALVYSFNPKFKVGQSKHSSHQRNKHQTYPNWFGGTEGARRADINESRSSTASKLLLSAGKSSHKKQNTQRSPNNLPQSRERNQQNHMFVNDTESISTDILLETSVYGNEPVNMGGNMHKPLYGDKRVKKILEESKCKKKKHLPQNSLLSRTLHGTENDESYTFPYQFGQSQFSPMSTKSRSFDNIKRRIASSPLPDRATGRPRPRSPTTSRVESKGHRADSRHTESPKVAHLTTPATYSNYEIRSTRDNRVSSSMTDLDLLREIEERREHRPRSSPSSEPSKRRPTDLVPGNISRVTSHSHLSIKQESLPSNKRPLSGSFLEGRSDRIDGEAAVDNLSHKTSGYLSGGPSFVTSHHKNDITTERSVKTSQSVPVQSSNRKVSGGSDNSANTDSMVRKSPTGIKYHSRSKSWNASNRNQDFAQPRLHNSSSPSLNSVNVITKRLEKQKLEKHNGSSKKSAEENIRRNIRLWEDGLERGSRSSGNNFAHRSGSNSSSASKDSGSEVVHNRWISPGEQLSSLGGKLDTNVIKNHEEDNDEIKYRFSNDGNGHFGQNQRVVISRTSPSTVSNGWKEFHHPNYYEELGKRLFSNGDKMSRLTPPSSSVNSRTKELEPANYKSYLSSKQSSAFDRKTVSSTPLRHSYPTPRSTLESRGIPSKALSLMSDTDSDIFSVNTELLLMQPPMPIINASPSLSTVSDTDTLCDSDSVSTTLAAHDFLEYDNMKTDNFHSSSFAADVNHNFTNPVNEVSGDPRAYNSYQRTFNPGYNVRKEEDYRNVNDWVTMQPEDDERLTPTNFDSSKATNLIMDTFIKDCINNAERRNGNRRQDLILPSEKKLSGGDHPGPIEALKHMLLNLQNETNHGSSLYDDESTIDDRSTDVTDEKDDASSLPGQQSLQRAYHHLERLKTLVHERSDRCSESSGIE